MSEDLKDFFSTVSRAKKKKEDEFNSLVGELNVDSLFSNINEYLKEEKRRKRREKLQAKAFESWLFSDDNKKNKIIEDVVEEFNSEEIQTIGELVENIEKKDVEEIKEERLIKKESDIISKSIKLIDGIKEEKDPINNTQFATFDDLKNHYKIFLDRIQQQLSTLGGGGETRLEFLDDIDRDSAKVNGNFLKYDSSIGKWVGGTASFIASEGGGSQDLNITLGLGNTSSLGMSVGIITATSFYGDGSKLTGISTFSGSYTDLTNTPTIPTNNSELINDVGYITTSFTDTSQLTNGAGFITGISTFSGDYNNLINAPSIPSDTGDLTNNIGFVTSSIVVGYVTEGYVDNLVSISTFSGNYEDLENIPTSLSTFNNDVGFITSYSETSTLNDILSRGNTSSIGINIGIITTNSLFVSGNVSIAGTLTYEDVNNIDSVGLVTARIGVRVDSGGLVVSGFSTFSGITTFQNNVFVGGNLQVSGNYGLSSKYSHQKIISSGSTNETLNLNNRTSLDIIVFVNGVSFLPYDDYSVSGTTLTFTEAPASDSIISIRYLPL